MNKNKSLKDKIIESVFIYETKKSTFDVGGRLIILLLSITLILIFGGIIGDIFLENEMGSLKGWEMKSVLIKEIPLWILAVSSVGILSVFILLVSIIKNRLIIVHKIISLYTYWIHQDN